MPRVRGRSSESRTPTPGEPPSRRADSKFVTGESIDARRRQAEHPVPQLVPATDPIEIRVETEHFSIARSAIKCVCQRFGEAKIEVSIGAALAMLRKIAREYSREGIEASGIARVVDTAFEKENGLIKRAAAILRGWVSWKRTFGSWHIAAPFEPALPRPAVTDWIATTTCSRMLRSTVSTDGQSTNRRIAADTKLASAGR